MSVSFRRFFLLAALILPILQSFSQQRQIGTWKVFMPYGSSLGACDAGDKVYDAGSKSIFSYEKSTGVIQTYDQSTGLNDIGIKTISYDPNTKFLAIAYINSNLDFIQNGTNVYNIPDIKNQSTTGSVAIYSISFLNGNAYVSSDLGISVVNLAQMQITSTYVIGSNGNQIPVYAASFDSVNIYAATAEGVKYAPRNAANLQDFNSWKVFGPAQNLPARQATYVQAYNNKVYAVVPSGNGSDTLYQYNGSVWSAIYAAAADTFSSLGVTNGNLYFTTWDGPGGSVGMLGKIDASGSLSVNQSQGHVKPYGWFESNGVSWEPDYWNGLFKHTPNGQEKIIPDGPFSSNVFELNCKNNVLDVAPGGVNDSWSFDYNQDGFFVYKNNTWTNRNEFTDPKLDTFTDILCTASVPSRSKTYFGSYYSGLIEEDDNSGDLNFYTQYSANGLMQSGSGDVNRTKVTCLFADSSDNLWIGNGGAPSLLKVIRADGTWRKFTVPYNILLLKRIVVDQQGQIWATSFQTNGVLVFNYGADMDNTSDDQYRLLQTGAGAGGLPSNNVFCIAVDHTGNVWVGTDQGIGTFYCPGSVFNGGCDATRIRVTLNGYVGYLFGMQTVRALAVDAANRIWVGTTEGLWLISNDGQTTYLNFTTANSPLPNNQITDISINDATGEVFIGTNGGLVSYQGDAIGASCSDCNSALVYPNPVKPDYNGPIAIKGLTDNAYVKITDASGFLIFQGRANGTQMIWNGNGYDGARAKSGVYLVFSSTDGGKEKRVAKILITN
jgi:Two component regulator propeller